jgi:hypothetical protein
MNIPLQKAVRFASSDFQVMNEWMNEALFNFLRVSFCIFKFNTCQFLRSLQTGALGNRLSRHGLATALFAVYIFE